MANRGDPSDHRALLEAPAACEATCRDLGCQNSSEANVRAEEHEPTHQAQTWQSLPSQSDGAEAYEDAGPTQECQDAPSFSNSTQVAAGRGYTHGEWIVIDERPERSPSEPEQSRSE